MLAETPRSSGNSATNIGGLVSAEKVITTVTALGASTDNPHGKTAATAGVPCVSLPHLRAILEHGGGITPADVSGLCELVVRKEDVSRGQRKTKTPEIQATPATVGSEAAAAGNGEPAVGLEADEIRSTRAEGELNGAHATGDENKDVRDTASRTATTDGSAGGRDGTTAEGHDQLMNQDQTALTVSFTTVSECNAVREWVRRGAYTLPAFDVTSGSRRVIR